MVSTRGFKINMMPLDQLLIIIILIYNALDQNFSRILEVLPPITLLTAYNGFTGVTRD